MVLTASQSIMVIAVVTAVTVCCRALPFVLFRDSRPVSASVIYLGRILPFSIISILVVYCLRGINFTAAAHWIPEIIATLLVVVIHIWKRNNLLSIGVSTIAYMLMVQYIFPLS